MKLSKREAKIGGVAAAAATLLASLAIGVSSLAAPDNTSMPKTATRVTVTATKTVTATPTVTKTVSVPGPTVTATVNVPGPTVTETVNVPVPGPTVTQTVNVPVPGPTVTEQVPVPGPTVTVTASPSATPTPTPTLPGGNPYPKVASVQQNSGESWSDACLRTMTYGYNGCVRYYPAGSIPSWDAQFQNLATKAGTKPVYIQMTAKTHSDSGLANVLANLPSMWKPLFIYNIYQEPEDNLTTATQQADYRSWYTAAAKVTRQYGVQLPWVEWHEYAGSWNLANFVPPASDYAGVLFSFFEYGEKDNVATQTTHIKSIMTTYAPGKPWALMAGAYTLEPAAGPYTDAQEQAQKNWLVKMYNSTKSAGSVGWAWYNVNFAGTGGASGEGRIEKNPYIGNLNNVIQ